MSEAYILMALFFKTLLLFGLLQQNNFNMVSLVPNQTSYSSLLRQPWFSHESQADSIRNAQAFCNYLLEPLVLKVHIWCAVCNMFFHTVPPNIRILLSVL